MGRGPRRQAFGFAGGQNIFNGIRTDLSKKHHDWFKDEENVQPELEVSDEPATKADILALSEMLA